MTPAIEWQITGLCNYRCHYCIQGNFPKKGFQPGKKELNRALDTLIKLEKKWELKISGGEPFLSNKFLDLVIPRLMNESNHEISILTNLFASKEQLKNFADLTKNRLRTFSASFHKDFTNLGQFLEKSNYIQEIIGDKPRIKVNVVLLPGLIPGIKKIKNEVEKNGFSFYGQFYKSGAKVWKYSLMDRIHLLRLIGRENSPRKVNKAPGYKGKRCLAGWKYFIIQKDGSSWACRSARRNNEHFLGNIYEMPLSFLENGITCTYSHCPCSVPYNRGMVLVKS